MTLIDALWQVYVEEKDKYGKRAVWVMNHEHEHSLLRGSGIASGCGDYDCEKKLLFGVPVIIEPLEENVHLERAAPNVQTSTIREHHPTAINLASIRTIGENETVKTLRLRPVELFGKRFKVAFDVVTDTLFIGMVTGE